MAYGYNSLNDRLTSVEVGALWSSYILESMVHHVFCYFSNNVDDDDIKTYVNFCKVSSRHHINSIKSVFEKENLPVPRGTTSEDINVNAPRLFSDKYYITYIRNMANFALLNYALAYAKSSRNDIRLLFKDKMLRLQDVDQIGTEISINKGIYNRPPHINIPNEVDFVEKESFFAGYFGNKRPLTVLEINQLYFNLESNQLGKALMMAFSQVAKSKEVHDYFIKGREVSDKYMKLFAGKLQDEDIAVPPSLESEILPVSSGQSPFSDRLMLNQAVFLTTYGIGNYGLSLSQSQRRDLTVMYGKTMVEIGLLADDGADLLIKNKWLEQPPIAPDRRNLLHMR